MATSSFAVRKKPPLSLSGKKTKADGRQLTALTMKKKTRFICQECGSSTVKWLGRCPDCSGWNTFVEEIVPDRRFSPEPRAGESPRKLAEILPSSENRFPCGIAELDRVLGGGLVSGSIVLIGGTPGIGKSTLLLQAASRLADGPGKVLYVSGEESLQQTKLRADRLGMISPSLFIMAEINLEVIMEQARSLKPRLMIMDSIQTAYIPDLPSAPGSVAQVRECAARLMRMAKGENIAVLLVGHVTKDGAIAGPRVLEHIVDSVLYFEGEAYQDYRMLRAIKNRFGSTNEVGIFEMTGSGLREVGNPSELFLSQRPQAAAGSAIVPVMEGSRPLLVEIQALVSRSVFGMPIRRSMGIDVNRLALLLAVLERRGGFSLADRDVFVNVVGGVRIEETSPDLGVIMAVASSLMDIPLDGADVFLGEVGLAGEIRAVSQADVRMAEAARLGFRRCILSRHNVEKHAEAGGYGIKTVGTDDIRDALCAAGLDMKERASAGRALS
jgi:DNA repair protein RadA/Sms